MSIGIESDPWPHGLTEAMGMFLPGSIVEVILQRAAESEGLGPVAWSSLGGRARLTRNICRRADIYLKPADRSRFRAALENAPEETEPRPGSAPQLPRGTSALERRASDPPPPGATGPGPVRQERLDALVAHRRVEERLAQHREAAAARSTPSPARPARSDRKEALSQVIPIEREIDILTARTATLALAQRAGAGVLLRTRAATVVSELARNIFRYAGRGTIRLLVEDDQLEIVAEDRGPGIPDVDYVLSGRYSSKTGMGMGLVGSKKIADDFQVESALGEGTRVRARLRLA